MMHIFLHTFLIFLILREMVLQSHPQCEHSFCNYHGLCYIESGIKKCKCLTGSYLGDRCNKQEDHCEPNPCKNGGMCKNFIGGYYCDCVNSYGGQNCTLERISTFQKVYLHYNRIIPVNSLQYFLIILEDLGSVTIDVDLYNSEYAIEVFTFPKGGPKFFKKSSNLRSVSSKFSIENPQDIPFNNGYYLNIKVKIFKLGLNSIVLSMTEAKNYDLYFFHIFNVLTYKSPEQCFPNISCFKCAMARQPYRLVIDQFTVIEPIIERSCGVNSQLQFQWTVKNYLSTETLHIFEEATNRELYIPPYALIFSDGTNFFRNFYTIILKVTEISTDGKLRDSSYFRCYILVILRPPKAIIIGGNYREASAALGFIVSAAESKDMNLNDRSNGKLYYFWKCTSSSQTLQDYCNKRLGHEPHLYVSFKKFKIGEKVNFSVMVRASTISMPDITWQEVTLVKEYRMVVKIICLKNCDRRFFNRQDLLHLKAVCESCQYLENVKYHWEMVFPKQSGIFQSGQRFILNGDLIPKVDKLIVRATVYCGSNVGYAELELRLNEPPHGRQCIYDPKSGLEYFDIFTIKCDKYQDVNGPIMYSIYQGEKILYRTTEELVKTRLRAGVPLRVKICDSLHACTSIHITVEVTEASELLELETLSDKSHKTNLWKVLQAGDKVGGIILIDMFSKQLQKTQSANKTEIVRELLNIINIFEITTDVAALQISSALKEVVHTVEMHHSLIIPINKVLTNIGKQLINIAKSSRIMFMHWEDYIQISKELGEVVEKTFVEINIFPIVHNYENFQVEPNPFYENYPDYGEMDFNLIAQIEDWRQSSVGIQHIFHGLGTMISIFMEPQEPKMDLEISSINIQFISIDHYNITNIELNKWDNELVFSNVFLKSIFGKISSSKHGIQIIIMKNNPFWWYPEQFRISSQVVLVNTFHEEIKHFEFIVNIGSTAEHFDLFFRIKNMNNSYTTTLAKKEVNDYVKRSSDLVLYSTKCFSGSIIVYNFSFIDDDLRVLANVKKKPRYWMMSKDYTVIRKGSNNNIYKIQNKLKEDSIAYIAIIPDNNKHDERVNFTFSTTEYSCATWNMLHSNWTFQHCIVGEKTTATQIHCRCNHLSTFASKLFVVPNKLVSKGLAKIGINFTVLMFVIIFSILLLSCLFWAAYKDRYYSRHFFIGSQDARNSYMYIITVATGNFLEAGTTALVFIQLNGKEGRSEKYLLYSRDRMLCQRNTVYTFTVFTKQSLGKLISITLTHDSTGRYPSWYCSIVRVKDIRERKEYIFLVKRWLSLIYNNKIIVDIPLSTKNELSKFKFLIREHFASKLDICFLFHLSCNAHTKNILNKKERTITFFTAKAAGALVSVMIFGQTTKYNVEDEHDEYRNITISSQILFVVMLGLIAALFTLVFLTFCFIKAKTRRRIDTELVFAN